MVGPLREVLRVMRGGPFEGSFLPVMHGGPFEGSVTRNAWWAFEGSFTRNAWLAI